MLASSTQLLERNRGDRKGGQPCRPAQRASGARGREMSQEQWSLDFPGGPVVRNLPANAGDTGLLPGLGRSHTLRDN